MNEKAIKKKLFGKSNPKKPETLVAVPAKPPTLECLKNSLIKHKGIVSLAAMEIGLDPMAFYFAIVKNPALANVWVVIQEMVRDEAREMLVKAARDGEGWAVKYLLMEGERKVPAFIESSGVVELKIARPKNAKAVGR